MTASDDSSMAASSDQNGWQSTPATQCVSPNAGRYLLEMYWLSADDEEQISTGTLSDRLDVSPASVTEMVSRLDDLGAVDYRKHRGVELTERGTDVAEVLAWRHCIVASFFREVLDAPIDVATAYELGFHLPEEGAATLGEKVGLPCLRACSDVSGDGDSPRVAGTGAV